jgi:hypothetical protein
MALKNIIVQDAEQCFDHGEGDPQPVPNRIEFTIGMVIYRSSRTTNGMWFAHPA